MNQIYSEETLKKFNEIFIKYLKLDMDDFYTRNIKQYNESSTFIDILLSLTNTLNIDLNVNLFELNSAKLNTLINIGTLFNYIDTNTISLLLYNTIIMNERSIDYEHYFGDIMFKTFSGKDDIFLYVEYVEFLYFEYKLLTMLNNNDSKLIEILKSEILNNLDEYLRMRSLDILELEYNGVKFAIESVKNIDIIDGKLYIDGFDYTALNILIYDEDANVTKMNLSSDYNLDMTLSDLIIAKCSTKFKKFKVNLIKKFFEETDTTLLKNNFSFNNTTEEIYYDVVEEDDEEDDKEEVKIKYILFKITKENLVKYLNEYLPKTNYNQHPSFKELYKEDFKMFKEFINHYKFTNDDIYNIVKKEKKQ